MAEAGAILRAMDVTCIADVKAVLGEGPSWNHASGELTFVDIKARRAFRWREDQPLQEFATPFRIGSLVPRGSGGFIAGTEHGIAAVDLDQGRFELLFDPEEDRPTNRFNDAKVDRSGRLFAGTMDDEEREASGAFYRIDRNLGCTRVDDGFRVTNGPAFSPDGRIAYANDSARQVTYRYDLAPDGTLLNRRELARYGEGEGYPDGMTVDLEGCLWIAFWDGWCLRRLSPEGERLAEVRVPVQRPTSCTFGGLALDRLFVTSARVGLEESELSAQPSAGGLFILSPGVRGIADQPFAG
jgi:xylono-1,5-lactonase